MQLELVDSFARLNDLHCEWSRFLQAMPGMTPFQTPEWLLTWWRHFGSGKLRVSVFRQHGEITAVIPSFLHEWNGRRQLTLIGSGISDYLEPAIAPAHCAQVIEELSRHLLETRDWDVCDWQDLEADSALAQLGPLIDDTACTEIKLTGAFEEYWAKRGKNLRRNVRRYGGRLGQMPTTEFAVASDTGAIEELIRLHRLRWRERGEAGMVEANHSADFLREVARDFAQRQMLRFFTLRHDAEMVAVILGFLHRNILYGYLSAFHPEFEMLGVGRRLLYESLRYAYAQHYSGWNFCRGEEPYKLWFGAERIPKCRLTLARAAAHIA